MKNPMATHSLGFRENYFDYETLTRQLQLWAKAFPNLVSLTSIGRTPKGRELWLLTISSDRDRLKPAVWIDGNMHASELAGSSAALAIAEDVMALHLGYKAVALSPAVAEQVKDVCFYVLPRFSPDGAEDVLKTGRYLRSSTEDKRPNQNHSFWRPQDMDGDGVVRLMRRRDETGGLVASKEFPGLLLPRTIDDEGPFYKVFPEGEIVNFDGTAIPNPSMFSDAEYDFNRNFPWQWAPEPEQAGAGPFPGSALETRAVMEFTSAHPNIFVWLNFHTFGGVFIRPLGHAADHKMNQQDLSVFRQIEQWNQELTGYPTVSGYHDFLYVPDKPLRGDMTDYAYHQRGAIAYVCELWDFFKRLGFAEQRPFTAHYNRLDRADLEKMALWDREHNKGRLYGRPWQPFKHPQLGDVEIGGIDMRVGLTNPPFEMLSDILAQQSAAFLRVASLLPKVRIKVSEKKSLAQGLTRIILKVQNEGYLATYGLPSAAELPISEPLYLDIETEGVELAAPLASRLEVGHLQGWGRGLHHSSVLFEPYSEGSVSEKSVTLVVSGKGSLKLKVGSCRAGYVTDQVEI